jgi:hypothetical protein
MRCIVPRPFSPWAPTHVAALADKPHQVRRTPLRLNYNFVILDL